MATETQQHEAPTETSQQAEQPSGQGQETEAEQRLGEAFRQELDQAIQPVVETIRTQIEETTPRESEQVGAQTQTPGLEVEEKPVVTVAVDRERAEQAIGAVLDSLLGSLFSDALRDTTRQQFDKTIRSLITASRRSLPKDQSLGEERDHFEQMLDDMLAEVFSETERAETRRRADKVIHDLVQWNVPSARRKGDKVLQTLADQRLTAYNNFWKQVHVTLLKASRQAAAEKSHPAGRRKSSPRSSSEKGSHDEKVPQTILRSDQRAQDIWTKAYDKAAEKDGKGRGAERAAYNTLKAQYEKKGDRWVKKANRTSKSRS